MVFRMPSTLYLSLWNFNQTGSQANKEGKNIRQRGELITEINVALQKLTWLHKFLKIVIVPPLYWKKTVFGTPLLVVVVTNSHCSHFIKLRKAVMCNILKILITQAIKRRVRFCNLHSTPYLQHSAQCILPIFVCFYHHFSLYLCFSFLCSFSLSVFCLTLTLFSCFFPFSLVLLFSQLHFSLVFSFPLFLYFSLSQFSFQVYRILRKS